MPKSKKFVLIICEGPTDENALYRIMKGFFNPMRLLAGLLMTSLLCICKSSITALKSVTALAEHCITC